MCGLKIAACGIDCSRCNLYNAGRDITAAQALVEWLRLRGLIGADDGVQAVRAKAPLCMGCRAQDGECFCGDCHLRACCDGKQLDHCGQCGDFPCVEYVEWTEGTEHHIKAMEYLMKRR